MSDLPSGWVLTTLSDVANFNPKHDPSRIDELVSFVPMPAVSAESGVIDAATDRPLADVWKGFTHFAEHDVLFAKITPCMENGKIAVAKGLTNGLGCGSTEFHVLRSNGAILPDYLWRFLRQSSFRKDAEGAMTGAVGQRRVPTDYLKSAEIPTPPLAEQRRIVEKLDALTARTARARADLDRIPALAARYKQAVLAKAFSEALDVSTIETTLGEISEFRNGLSRRPEHSPPGLPILKISAIRPLAVRLEEIRYYQCEADEDVAKYRLHLGDLLFTRFNGNPSLVASCGLVRELPQEGLLYPDKLIRVRLDQDRILPEFSEIIVSSPQARRQLEKKIKSAAGQHGISGADLKLLHMPLPDLQTQELIAQRTHTALGNIDLMVTEAAAARRLLDRLDQSVLAKAFRGELLPQNPSDEPASALLDRIRAERAAAPKAKRGRRKAAA